MAQSRITLVTGANSGIGYQIVKALVQSSQPYHILVAARSQEKAQSAIKGIEKEVSKSSNTMEPIEIDLTSDDTIERAFKQIETNQKRLDVLINNAGATFDIAYQNGKTDLRSCFNNAYDVNVSGTNVLTHTLMPLLLKSDDPRLIFISGLSSITRAAEKYFPTPPLPAGWPKTVPEPAIETIGYRCSKVALNMLMLDWNHKLQADGVKVWAVGPGAVLTNLGGLDPEKAKAMGVGDPAVSGDTVRRVVEGERDADVGKFVAKEGSFVAW